jgi:hypothetical protein
MNDANVKKNTKVSFTANRVINYILGLLEILLAFRLIFKILGANAGSGFVSFIYSITQIFLTPFTAIFRPAVAQGIETKAVLEPSTIIAMIVYALIAWGIVKLIMTFRGHNESKV